MTDFSNEGKSAPYTPGSDMTAGDVALVESKIVVAKHDIASGVEGTVAMQGAFKFPKTAATAYTQFKPLYWDVADTEATEDDDTGTNKQIGYVYKDAASGDDFVWGYLTNTTAA